MAWAWKQKELTASQKLVLMGLANYANMDDVTAFPSVRTLATDCGVGARTVERCFLELEGMHLIERLPQYRSDGSRTSNLYKLHVRMAEPPATVTPPPAPVAGLEPVIEPEDSKNPPTPRRSRPPTPPAAPPPELEEFDSILREAWPPDEYAPSGGFYTDWLRNYVGLDYLDLLEEAVLMVDQQEQAPASKKRKHKARFVTTWLRKVKQEREHGTAQRQGTGTTRKRDGRDPWADGTDGYRDDGAIPEVPEVQGHGVDLDASGARAEIRE